MTRNVGPRETLLRMAVGSIALGTAIFARSLGRRSRWLLGAFSVVNFATAFTRACPGNALLGIDNTRGKELVHFRRSPGFRGRLGRRANQFQRRVGATVARA